MNIFGVHHVCYEFCIVPQHTTLFGSFSMYEGHLQSLWTRLITTSQNFMAVRWQSPFQSTSLGKWCTSYNTPPTWKCAANYWSLWNFLPQSSLFMVGKPRNCVGWNLNWILCSAWIKWIGGTPLEHPPYSPDLTPCDFLAFPTMKRELWAKKFQSDQQSAACFQEVGGVL
jgi:hypothetical protein